MRLLHTDTLSLVGFLGENVLEYAILSHTWETAELSLQDLQQWKVLANSNESNRLGVITGVNARQNYGYGRIL